MKTRTTRNPFPAGLSGVLTCITILLIPLLVQGQAKRYNLKLGWKAVEGHRSEVREDDSQQFKVTVSANGQVLNQNENSDSKSFVATEVVTKVRAEKPSELRWSFSKAAQTVEGVEKPYQFQGKTVVVTLDEKYQHTFAYENGDGLAPEDAAVLANFHAGHDPKPDEPLGDQIFAPPHPVAVGESWVPDVALMAKSFGSDSMAIDVSRSTAKATLLSATTRGTSDFGVIELSLELYVTKFGPIQLETPVPMHFSARIEACIDETLPDGTMNLGMELNGETVGILPDGAHKVNLKLEMQSAGHMETRTVL